MQQQDAASLVRRLQADNVKRIELQSFSLGTGDSILDHACADIATTQHELLFVTCFWAQSSSLDRICRVLRQLSGKVQQSPTPRDKIRVRICLSSVGLFQKLFHTQSKDGYIYPDKSLKKKLNIPEDLPGLDIQVKSIFIKPFSVMHPKFILIDRRKCLLPSCNVSWEDWFEGCLSMTGQIVDDFVSFWREHWQTPGFSIPLVIPSSVDTLATMTTANLLAQSSLNTSSTKAILLEHPHHINPRFSFRATPAPVTSLNSYTLHLLATATSSIYMQTPNLTSPPVLRALDAALERGVHVHIVTNPRLMTLEQLLTALTTTPRCVRRLLASHRARLARHSPPNPPSSTNHESFITDDAAARPGRLTVEYFTAAAHVALKSPSRGQTAQMARHAEPVRSHLKLAVVDARHVLLGSGNMDRASWFTSQELGLVLLDCAEIAAHVFALVRGALGGRVDLVYRDDV